MSKRFSKSTRSKGKFYKLIQDADLGATNEIVELHTAVQVPRTFIGAVVQGSIYGLGLSSGRMLCIIYAKPENVEDPGTLQLDNLDDEYTDSIAEETVVWSKVLHIPGGTTSGLHFHHQFNERIKSKRKLKPGDVMTWVARANSAGIIGVNVSVTGFNLI